MSSFTFADAVQSNDLAFVTNVMNRLDDSCKKIIETCDQLVVDLNKQRSYIAYLKKLVAAGKRAPVGGIPYEMQVILFDGVLESHTKPTLTRLTEQLGVEDDQYQALKKRVNDLRTEQEKKPRVDANGSAHD